MEETGEALEGEALEAQVSLLESAIKAGSIPQSDVYIISKEGNKIFTSR